MNRSHCRYLPWQNLWKQRHVCVCLLWQMKLLNYKTGSGSVVLCVVIWLMTGITWTFLPRWPDLEGPCPWTSARLEQVSHILTDLNRSLSLYSVHNAACAAFCHFCSFSVLLTYKQLHRHSVCPHGDMPLCSYSTMGGKKIFFSSLP